MVSNTREDEDMLVDLLRHFVSICLYTSVATVSRGLGTPNYSHVHTGSTVQITGKVTHASE